MSLQTEYQLTAHRMNELLGKASLTSDEQQELSRLESAAAKLAHEAEATNGIYAEKCPDGHFISNARAVAG